MIQIKRDVDLSHLNTMRLKSTAEALVEIHERSQLLDICEQLPKYDKWQVLGGGSNLILAPRITGLTVLMRTTGRQVQAKGNEIIVEAEAGEIWHEFVQWTLQQGFW
ncbi:MAG TPA: FAD-binding protein, partial [Pseudobdellovibrionaceae bacterium]|nr:FAD-binding protein [Pseudobdellovibrionaceae bacterium]